jgi:pimeloyl-ACP methyl ester carboxylesterase
MPITIIRTLVSVIVAWGLILILLIPPNHGQSAPLRPVVVVPGILGSKLCHGQEVVWGGGSSLKNFGRLDLVAVNPEPLQPCGLLEQVAILGPFWKIDAYSGLLTTLKQLGYIEGQNLFVFTYDWRQSNLETAEILKKFIEEINAPKVDIIAHSMGGVVSVVYLQNHGGADRVNKIVFLGTPFLGSMNAFSLLSEGWGGVQNILAGGIETIRNTALSFPALYDLFPRYENCCRVGTQAVDPVDPNNWRRYNWLPRSYDRGSRAKYFDDQLTKTKTLREVMRKRLPTNVGAIKVVGDVFGTNLYLHACSSDPSWERWQFTKARGDETVPAWSAANNPESLSDTIPSFSVHGTIFNDRTVQSIIERELLEVSMPKRIRLRGLPTKSDPARPFNYIDISVEPNTLPTGARAKLSMTVHWAIATDKGEYEPRALLKGPTQDTTIGFVESTSADDLAENMAKFVGEFDAPTEPGTWRIVFDFGDFDADYLGVLTTFVP